MIRLALLWSAVAADEPIPENFTGALCKCYTENIITEKYREEQLAFGHELPKGDKIHTLPCRVDKDMVPYLNHNSTHCYSLLGECYREDEYDRKHRELHDSDNPCDYELTRREFGCITPHAGWHAKQPNATDSEVQSWKANSFGYTAVCGLVNSRDQDKQCCMGDMCNDKLTMEKEQNYIEKCVTPLHVKVLIAVLTLLGLFVLFGVVIFLIKPSWIKSLCQVLISQYKSTKSVPPKTDEENSLYSNTSPRDSRDDGTNDCFHSQNTTVTNLPSSSHFSSSAENNITDGMKDSERGPAVLVQRTIARQITISERVGSGRYGEVYQGEWQGMPVAVKKFHAWDDKSWQREYEIYGSLTHQNVLGFIAADNKDNGQWTELWLVTEYHLSGSVFDYLQERIVSPLEAVRMMYTAVNGLEYIHKEIVGTSGKHAIAHRDVKSKNILVKSNGECCICDLGLAIRSDWTRNTDAKNSRLFEKNNLHVGTKRYMAPEVLDNTLDQTQFNNFKRADVYSMALVMWEILNRTQITPEYQCDSYHLPYDEYYKKDPSLEEMRLIIVDYEYRPDTEFDEFIHLNDDLNQVRLLIEECWSREGLARLPTLRLKKSMLSIYEKMKSVQ